MRLTGFNVPLRVGIPSPDGAGLALPFLQKVPDGPGGPDTGLLILAGSGKIPWLAISSSNDLYQSFQWLPGNQLIWIDQGKLYTARSDGSQKANYPLPDTLMEVWSNGAWAIASGEKGLWRVNLVSQDRARIEGMGDSSGPVVSAAEMIPDGSGLLVKSGGTIVKIPFDPRGAVVSYGNIQEYSGREGRIGAPRALVGSPFVFPGEMETTVDGQIRVSLLQAGDSQPIPLSTLIGVDTDMLTGLPWISPDGKWTAIGIYRRQSDNGFGDQVGIYVVSSIDLSHGRIVPGDAWYWRVNPPTAILLHNGAVSQMSLSTYEEKVLGRLAGDWPRISVADDLTMLSSGSQIALFDTNGDLRDVIDLPYSQLAPYYAAELQSLTLGNQGNIYIEGQTARQNGSNCEAVYWLEVIHESTKNQ